MSLSTYAGLVASVRTWTRRKDDSVALINDYISLCEQHIYANDEAAPLRIKEMESRQRAPVTTTSNFLQLPDDFLEMRRLKILAQTLTVPGPSQDADVDFRTPNQLEIWPVTGMPRFFSVTTQIEFDRVPDQLYEVEMQLYIRLEPLSTTNSTNAILTQFPSIYLQGCLWAAWWMHAEEEKAEYHYSKFMAAIKGANAQNKKARFGPTPQIKHERARP